MAEPGSVHLPPGGLRSMDRNSFQLATNASSRLQSPSDHEASARFGYGMLILAGTVEPMRQGIASEVRHLPRIEVEY